MCSDCQQLEGIGSTKIQIPPTHTLLESGDSESTGGRRQAWSASGLAAGDVLAGRFRIVRALGRGGMGEVFEAEDSSLNDRVALKVVRSRETDSEESLQRLRREVLLARRVTHGNVCRIFDLIQHRDEKTGDAFALVSMELLDGETLSQHFARRGAMSVESVLPIVRQIARGLIAAHRLGIVHRDLKPSNVMLVEESDGVRVAITDFGLAHSTGPESHPDTGATQKGLVVGTPAYMTPEQVAGETTSPATDIYSLGVIVYELLSGKLPFAGNSPWQMAISRMTEDPKPLARHRPDLAPSLLRLVDRCLERNPARRFASASEILKSLDFGDSSWDVYGRKINDGELAGPGGKRQDPIPEPAVAKPSPSKRWVAGALVLALAAAAVAGWRSLQRAEQPWPGAVMSSESQAVDDALRDLPALPTAHSTTATKDAALLVIEALEISARHLAAYDGRSARRSLAKALEAEPESPQLLASLAQAYWREGRELEARSAISTADGLKSSLSKIERQQLTALKQGFDGDWQQSRKSLEALWQQGDTDLEIGLWLAEATWLSGWVEAMPDLFATMRAQNPQDPRIDLWQSWNVRRLGDFEKEEHLAHKVVEAARRNGTLFLELEGLRSQARAFRSLGKNLEFERTLERFHELAAQSSLRLYQARSLEEEARVLDNLGREEQALEKLLEVDAAYHELGSLSGRCLSNQIFGMLRSMPKRQAQYLSNAVDHCQHAGMQGAEALARYQLARAFRDRGDFARAAKLFQHSTEQMEALGSHDGIALSRVGLAFLFDRMGRVEEMKQNLLAVEPWFRSKSDVEKLTTTLLGLSLATIRNGNIGHASTYLDQADAFGLSETRLLDLHELRCSIAFESGDALALHSAATLFRELADKVLEKGFLAKAEAFLGVSFLLGGNLEESLERLDKKGRGSMVGMRFLIEALAQQGDLKAALLVLKDMAQLATKKRDQNDLWTVEILSASLQKEAARDDRIERLLTVERLAASQGSRLTEVEAKLARARLTVDSRLLREVRDEARSYGFGRLATAATSSL